MTFFVFSRMLFNVLGPFGFVSLEQYHKMVEIGKDFWRSSWPAPCSAGSPQASCPGPCL